MAGNPACGRYIPQLSAYIDGELTPAERTHVEHHLGACKDCTARAADLRAESGLVRVGLEMAGDDIDWKDFTQSVMARITPERPPLLERLRLSLSEMFLHQRAVMGTAFVTAAVVLLVAVPLIARNSGPAAGWGGERMAVESVTPSEQSLVSPVVLEADGDSIIWVVPLAQGQGGGRGEGGEESRSDELEMDEGLAPDAPAARPGTKPAAKPRPKGGEL